MISIDTHPNFRNVNPFKKRAQMIKVGLAKQMAKMIDSKKVVAVVGSVGKTTTIKALEAILPEAETIVSINDPLINIPSTLLQVKNKHKFVILEMGMEYPGELDYYLNLIKPKAVLLTRIGYEHTETLGGIEDITRELTRLFEQLPQDGLAILNYDDLSSRKLAEKINSEIVFYGTDSKNCHVWAGNIKINGFMTCFELNWGVERVEIRSELLGQHQVYSMLGAAAYGVSKGLSLISIKRGLEKILPLSSKMQAFTGHNGSVIVDDTDDATPFAVEQAIETLNLVTARRRVVVLGQMPGLGRLSEQLHREIARTIYKEKIDLVFLGSGDAQYIEDELRKLGFLEERMQSNMTNSALVSNLLKILAKGDVVLIKGSKSLRFDEVVQRVAKKG